MNSTVIAAIQTFTLQARDWLETEVGEQLEGIYGWLPSGELNPAQQYPALKAIPEATQTRKDLESYIAESREAGINAADARRKLLRETAFTWLNRLVSLHMLEERRLIRASVSRLAESNAYLYWLADEVDPAARQLHDQGELPLNLMGEGPRHVAYRRFLLWQCGQLAKDVSVLFAPDSLSSRLFPRPSVLKSIIEAMHDEQIVEAWQAGNEETVGWVYQSFNKNEKKAVFNNFSKGIKVSTDGIAPATQTFTLRWVVKYLVENSLGRLWLEMHPNSSLSNELNYFVPGVTVTTRPLKPVRDIRLLDPACGSMHFGLMAFDLFASMYREELRNAGKPGWPAQASVASEDEIPATIIRHNLYGIDIDLRAIQLSALTLFLRAKSLNPNCVFTDRNLACANIQHITGGRLDGFVKAASWTHPIQKRIVTALAEQLADSENLGSLLRVEIYLQDLISAERKQARQSMDALFAADKFGSDEEMETFFETIESDVAQKLDEFVRKSRIDGKEASHFAAEASKGLRFMRLVQKHYDVVVTNPPYMDSRDYNHVHKAFLEREYPTGKRNLFAAFILRCLELTAAKGFTGMITGQSFMFTTTYEEFREKIAGQFEVQTLAQFDYHLFDERVDTAAFVLRREPDPAARAAHVGTYFRLVREKNAEAKQLAFEAALAVLNFGKSHSQVFFATMSQFEAIPDKPWSYWMPKRFQKLFSELSLIKDVATPRVGLQTGDNNRFLRLWWEVGTDRIGLNHTGRDEARGSGKHWFPYMKGGAALAWFGNQTYVVDWSEDGAAIRCFGAETGKIRSRPQNTDYYFRPGVTWSLIASKGFAARLSPGGFIFDVNGMMCFPPEKIRSNVLALLNSKQARFLLSSLNDTLAYQIGDIERLPVPDSRSAFIEDLVAQCVELARQNSRDSEITYDFVAPIADPSVVISRKETLAEMERKIDEAVSTLYGLTEEDLAVIDRELSAAKTMSSEDVAETESDDVEEAEDEKQAVTPANWARSWLSYAVGIVLGRFEIGKVNGLGCGAFSAAVSGELRKLAVTDGILVNDAGEPLDLAGRVWQAMILMLGESGAKSRVQVALGEGNPQDLLRGWLNRFSGAAEVTFWKIHHQQYKKRPVYWPLQSPKRRYTVWLFHERLTGDTLFHIRGNIVEPRLALALRQADDLKEKANTDRQARKERDELLGLVDDLREFSKRLKQITEQGYAPHIDDGVLLNAAPLHEVLPSWPDCAKAWKELADGKLDWAHQAMVYWPERVGKKCKTDASLAIAHAKDKK